MKTKSLTQDKISIITLGCAKNLVDSEAIFTQLKGNGMNVSHDADDSSKIVIVNTCGFIDEAKQESIDTILQYAEAKSEGLLKKLYVAGCLSERYRDDLRKEIPQVDAFFGTSEMYRLLKTLKADYKKELVGERVSSTPSHYAYLKISEGCDRPCSFCAIPLMRGGHKSKPMEEVIQEASGLVKKGVKELLLIAQDSTYYGLDLYGKRNLAELLERLSEIEGLEWIRLHYAFPSGFPKDVLKVIAEKPNICNYLDIPLQHGSTNQLKLMRRGITREKTEELIKEIRQVVPGIAIRTTMIVGHPGETEADWQEMVEFVQSNRFDRLGVFTYSHEENTHSFEMRDDVPSEIKQKRANELMQIQQEISYEINQEKVGKRLKVLVDREENDYFIGRTEYDSPEVDNEVLIEKAGKGLSVGNFVTVEINEATEFDLYASPIAP